MKRRDFLQKSTLVAGLAGSQTLLTPLLASENKTARAAPSKPQATATSKEVCTAKYLKRARVQRNPPKLPTMRESETADGISVLSLPLLERLKRKIVPRMGFCSVEPGTTISDGVTSGNGHTAAGMTLRRTGVCIKCAPGSRRSAVSAVHLLNLL